MATEKRLIDANALLREVMEGHPYEGLSMAAQVCTMELLTYAPTVDAVEVVHGRWEPHPKHSCFDRCSVCNDCIIANDWIDGIKWKFCPNCGAKMDGERKDNE